MPETNIPIPPELLNACSSGMPLYVAHWESYKLLFPFTVEKWGPIRDLSVDAYIDQPFN
jgi:hypothetical protein